MTLSKYVLTPDWPQLPAQFSALVTLRTGGVSHSLYDDGSGGGGLNLADHVGDHIDHVLENRERLRQLLPSQPSWLSQVHGINVLNLDSQQDNLVADACMTTQPDVVCAVLTADCLPVLLCDPKAGVVAAAHAGWRGLADGVLENTVAAMQTAGANPDAISAWLGPAIGPAQFEVGQEVRERFIEEDTGAVNAFIAHPAQPDKFYANIFQLAQMRLRRVGVCQFAGGAHCTVSESQKFYSYRRDGKTGRMASLIWIKGENPIRHAT